MQKIISFLLSVLFVVLSSIGFMGREYPVHIEGAIFGGESADNVATAFKFDNKMLTWASNKKYNKALASFSAILCADSYYREKDMAKGTQNRVLVDDSTSDYDFTALLKAVGFTEVKHIESFKEKSYAADSNDSVTMNLGHMSDGRHDIYAVVFRGCYSAGEWLSAFDPGCDCPEYTALTGEHPEWKNKNNLKGFDIAAERAKEFINEFIAENDDSSLPDCVLFTGHSRGGAIANIIGAFYEKNSDYKTFTYTFNTLPVTADLGAEEYKTVFNIFDSSDFYTSPLPFGNEKFSRYGKDLQKNIAETPEVQRAITGLMGRADYLCPSADFLAKYAELFGRCFPGRESLYKMAAVTETYNTAEQAQARQAECEALAHGASGLGLGKLFAVNEVAENESGEYELKLEYCPAALLTSYSMILAYGSAAFEAVEKLFANDEDGVKIAKMLIEDPAALSSAHRLADTYILTGFVK